MKWNGKNRREVQLRKFGRIFLLCVAFGWAVLQPLAIRDALAAGLLRDAETELFLRQITDPILIAAGLNPESVHIYIVDDSSLNAFAGGGQNIFITTGMLLAGENVNQLIGVIAHETGHIAGGHQVRAGEARGGASAMSLISLLLGAAAMAAGSANAGIGLLMGGQSMAQRQMLSFSREQESRTDQAGARFLQKAGISGRGSIEMFEIMQRKAILYRLGQNEYLRSHPLTQDRIARLREIVSSSPFYDKPPDPVHQAWFERIQGKLGGFVYDPETTYRLYPESDQSIAALYARAYAYNKDRRWNEAIVEVDKMTADEPGNAYYYELGGQIMLEHDDLEGSIVYYRRANQLLPRNSLIMTALAHALVALETPEYDLEAIALLKQVVVMDPINDLAWHQLGIVYTRNNMETDASLATAELFSLYGRFYEARYYAGLAAQDLPEGTPRWIRAQDILVFAENELEERARNPRARR
jgi:predicted Zn-dependent protease